MLTEQDRSDIRHLSTAIHHQAAGFITSEKAILRANDQLRTEFRLDVIGLEDFASMGEIDAVPKPKNLTVRTTIGRTQVDSLKPEEEPEVRSFLNSISIPSEFLEDSLSKDTLEGPRQRLVARIDGEVVGFGSWDSVIGPRKTKEIFVCGNEEHPSLREIVDYLIDLAAKELSSSGPILLHLQDLAGRPLTRQVALSQGFRTTSTAHGSVRGLQKIAIGQPVFSDNWTSICNDLDRVTGVKLPETPPDLSNADEVIRLVSAAGERLTLSIKELESLLSPVLFLFSSRKAAIVPIRRPFADSLLGTSNQFSLLEQSEALLMHERAFFCTPSAAKVMAPGTPLLFYESGKMKGRSSVVAVGRSVTSETILKTDIPTTLERRGVLDRVELDKIGKNQRLLATKFDNVMTLRKPVSLAKLRTLGCVDGTNLVTARTISGSAFMDVIRAGNENG
tara:strand:- start:1143 stop:2489 length:1347 start_codon:yes stop_codon:yes gene_type:complete